jgi:hypothetical protein
MFNHIVQLVAIVANISTQKKGARFASLTYTAKGTGEVARHTVCLGVSVERAYRRDIAMLSAKRDSLQGVALVACDELITSLQESLDKGIGNNSAYTCAGVYESVCRGVKFHKETGEVYVTGFSIGKEIIIKGEHKAVKSSEKTIAKNALRREMKSGKFRQFALPVVASARAEGAKLVFA